MMVTLLLVMAVLLLVARSEEVEVEVEDEADEHNHFVLSIQQVVHNLLSMMIVRVYRVHILIYQIRLMSFDGSVLSHEIPRHVRLIYRQTVDEDLLTQIQILTQILTQIPSQTNFLIHDQDE